MTATNRREQKYDGHDLWRKDHDHHIHPFSHFPTFKKEGALVIAEGDGAYVFDTDGRRFVVARRNEPGCSDPRGLASREKQAAEHLGYGYAAKEIAYGFGRGPRASS